MQKGCEPNGHAAGRPSSDRGDGARRARACSTSAAVTARCCSFWPTPRPSTGAGSSLRREKVNACVMRGLSVIQGDADRDLSDYPDQAFDFAILSLTIQADARSQDRAREPAQDRPARHRVVPELRPLAGARAASAHRPHAGDAQSAGAMVRDGGCASLHHQGLRALWSILWARRSRMPWPSTATGKRLPIKNSISLQNLLGEKAVFKLRRKRSRLRVCSFLTYGVGGW